MRISIDTGELHTLAGVYRREADDLNRTAAKLRAHTGTALNHQDPAIRAAHVPDRVAVLALRSDRIADDLRVDAINFDRIARTMEDDQGGGLLTHPDWPASTMPVPILKPIPDLRWIRPLPKWGDDEGKVARPIRIAVRPEDRFVNGLRDALRRFQRGTANTWAAGKRATTSVFGHVRDLTRSVAGAIHRFGKRVAHFTAAAWTRGQDFAARTYRTVVDGIRRCISAAGQAFQSALHTITTTGKFIADTATFTWDLIKSLPGHALDAFKKLHKALVELPVWKYVKDLGSFVYGFGALFVGVIESKSAPVRLERYDGSDGRRPSDAFDEGLDPTQRHEAPASSTSDYMAKLNDLKPGMIEIIKVDGDPPSYVVLLKGIDGFGPGDLNSANRTDLASAMLERYGIDSAWGRAIRAAMDQTIPPPPPKARVMLMGHSGGGIVASNLAGNKAFQDRYSVDDIVIAASGVPDHLANIPSNTNVVMLQHRTDYVAAGILAAGPDNAVEFLTKGQAQLRSRHDGNQGFYVFDAPNTYSPDKDHGSGHHPWYYQEQLRKPGDPHLGEQVALMDKKYAPGPHGSVSSTYYRMPDR